MNIVPREIVQAAATMAMSGRLTPSQTMAVVFRALDHELGGFGTEPLNPARVPGVGAAIYAAMFGYPFDLVLRDDGYCWQAELPEHGYSAPFQQLFIDAMLMVDAQRAAREKLTV
ncbi:hypothetical protein [Chitinolyticbacter meiyuanensis]|uniref:hypothetical protein n=1 Tax=Chitinolyticbacter meiyuanensis TaxID=682798 RepID=UPI0011E607B8|nr:hypothetical protein [Chitinolyticbacter meiyuanensis]